MVVVGVKTKRRLVSQVLVNEEMDMIFYVVYKPERRDRTGLKAEILFHAHTRCKGKFALVQRVFKVVNGKVALAVENDKIVTIALVVPEEEVLAMLRTIGPPLCAGYFNSRGLVVSVPCMLNSVLGQIV